VIKNRAANLQLKNRSLKEFIEKINLTIISLKNKNHSI
jgi:hypothetical protein